jgi:hypothetical protein
MRRSQYIFPNTSLVGNYHVDAISGDGNFVKCGRVSEENMLGWTEIRASNGKEANLLASP